MARRRLEDVSPKDLEAECVTDSIFQGGNGVAKGFDVQKGKPIPSMTEQLPQEAQTCHTNPVKLSSRDVGLMTN